MTFKVSDVNCAMVFTSVRKQREPRGRGIVAIDQFSGFDADQAWTQLPEKTMPLNLDQVAARRSASPYDGRHRHCDIAISGYNSVNVFLSAGNDQNKP